MRILLAALTGLLCSVSLTALLAAPAAAAESAERIVVAQAQPQPLTEEQKKKIQQQHQKGQGQGQGQHQKGGQPEGQKRQTTQPQPKPAPKVLTPTPTPKVFPKATTTPPPLPKATTTTPPSMAPKTTAPALTTAPAPKVLDTPAPGAKLKKGPAPVGATTTAPQGGTAATTQQTAPKTFNRDERGRFRKFGNQPPAAGPAAGGATAVKVPQGAYKQVTRTTTTTTTFKKVDDIKSNRQVKVEGGVKVITEPGNRTIIRQDNRVVIRNDETNRFRLFGSNVKTVPTRNGLNMTTVVRPGGVKIISVMDARGNLVERRRWWNGRSVRLIDNRRVWGPGAKIGLGVGIGLGIAALTVALAPPVHALPRRQYIVEYADASPDDLYEALSAEPVERLDRRYSLEEIRYSVSLRDRMRRVDLDINFDTGAWDVTPDQYSRLERIARVINRIIEKNPEEVVMIEGHTDAIGESEDNLSLSDRRAESVATILTREFDVPPENLVTQGYGEQFLKVPTQGPERANRRVTIRRVTPLMAREESAGPGDRDDMDGDGGPRDRDDDRGGRDRDGDRYEDRR